MSLSLSDSRKARDIVRHLLPLIERFTVDKHGAGLVLYEQERETWYLLEPHSLRAICLSKYGHELRNDAAVKEATRMLIDRASGLIIRTNTRPFYDLQTSRLYFRVL